MANDQRAGRPRSARGRRDAGSYRSGQTGQTVNLMAYAFAGSNPALPTENCGIAEFRIANWERQMTNERAESHIGNSQFDIPNLALRV